MEFKVKWWKFKIILSILIITFNNCIEATKIDDENININFPRLITTPTNRILKIDTKCTAQNLSLNITMEKPFKGVIFAKDFPQECKTLGIFEQIISLNLPTRGCGVRLASSSLSSSANINNINDDTNNLHYTVTVIVQMDRHLRQITDQERTISCTLDHNETKLHSNAMRQAIMEMMKKDLRTGRMKNDWITSDSTSNLPSEDEIQVLDESRAWMEILGDRDANPSYNADDTVKVGDTMTLTVKSTLPENIGWRVINCMAHDGIGDSSQKLLDDYGCPVDEQILPELKLSQPRMIGPNTNKIITKRNRKVSETVWNARSKRAVVKKTGEELKEYNGGSDLENSEKKQQMQSLSMMRYQEASAKFSAFKFPDRDRLHLSCGLQLCKGKCQQIDCKSLNRASRHLVKKKTKENNSTIPKDVVLKSETSTPNIQDEILDTLEVYNSVEVIAPDIELDDYRGRSLFRESTPKRKTKLITSIPGDRTFCVSTNKMALTFCILGVIFIIAVVVAIISLLRSRRKDIRSYYSRSVFSSSTSTGSGFGGSKLLLHESPCLGVARSWQYGRAF